MTAPCAPSLYAGPELHRAAELSRLERHFAERLRGPRNAAGILTDIIGKRLRRETAADLEFVLASGRCPERGERLTVACAGPGEHRAWCLSLVLDEPEELERTVASGHDHLGELLASSAASADLLFCEGLPPALLSRVPATFARMPAWVKQRIPLLGDWPAQIDGLRRVTRQETGRMLRKYGYGCRISRQSEDFAHFHDRLYAPYVAQRFGASAQLVGRQAFLRECRRGILLQLTRGDAVPGAALLRPVGRTVSVVWSALDPERDSALKGVTDALDYFSLLYAHLRGGRWLDLGPSRPNLRDGTLRYKAKWGSAIYAGFTQQTNIAWACPGPHEATSRLRPFLSRHAFLLQRGRRGGQLRAVICIDGKEQPAAVASRLSEIVTPGVTDYRLVSLSPLADETRRAVRQCLTKATNVTIVEAASYPDIMAALTDD